PVLNGARLRHRVLWGRSLRVLGALWFGVAVALAAGTAGAAAAPGAGSAAAHGTLSQFSAGSQAAEEEPPTAPAPVRIGGSDPQPSPGTPGWVWWGVGSFAVVLAVGTYRLWRAAATQRGAATKESLPRDVPLGAVDAA